MESLTSIAKKAIQGAINNPDRVVIKRDYQEVTIGELSLYEKGHLIHKGHTIELKWLDNEPRVSCIPEGVYNVLPRTSKKYGDHFI